MNSILQTQKKITRLDDFISALNSNEQSKYDSIIRSTDLPNSVFKDFISWSKTCYTRNCIVENEKFELILLCWEGGQITPIHNHGGEECWVKIIEGEFRETIYNQNQNQVGELKMGKSVVSKTNDVSYMIDFMGFHNLENLSAKRSMTLHLYAKPIRSCKIYDESSQKFVKKDLVYHTCPEVAAN